MQWPEVHEELSTRAAPENPLVAHGATSATIGKPLDWPTYGWDNEYGRRDVQVPAFEATKFQVSNGELLEFVKAGGYRDEHLWSPEGWKWCAPKRCCSALTVVNLLLQSQGWLPLLHCHVCASALRPDNRGARGTKQSGECVYGLFRGASPSLPLLLRNVSGSELRGCPACRRTFRNAKWPVFWVPHGPQGLHQYRLRIIWRTVEWAAAAPAIVNVHEARAYAAWRTQQDGSSGMAHLTAPDGDLKHCPARGIGFGAVSYTHLTLPTKA